MIQDFINSISNNTLLYTTFGCCVLFPYAIPVWLFSAMMITFCKSPNFMDEEFSRREAIKMLYDDEHISDEELETVDELTVDELRMRISQLQSEIAGYKTTTTATTTTDDTNTSNDTTEEVDVDEITSTNEEDTDMVVPDKKND